MSAHQHFLQIEGDMGPTVVCTAPAGAPCHMVCDSCEESCCCDKPTLRDMGECNYVAWLSNDDDVMECGSGSGIAQLPIDIKWEGDYYSWSFAKPVSS